MTRFEVEIVVESEIKGQVSVRSIRSTLSVRSIRSTPPHPALKFALVKWVCKGITVNHSPDKSCVSTKEIRAYYRYDFAHGCKNLA